jgi:putative oxidoreductase
MLDASTPLVIPALGHLYAALGPLVEALLRLVVAAALIMHGLRMTFGFFPNTGIPLRNVRMLAAQFERDGYRPGWLWARTISITQLVGGPMLALGLFTRLAAIPIVIFLAVAIVDRWRANGYFWNKLGVEYVLLWGVAALYFLVNGGGLYSLDRLIGREF